MRNLIFIILCFLALFLVSGCISSQNYSILENRVAVLEMDNARLINKEVAESKDLSVSVNRVESGLESTERSYREGYADLKSLMEELSQENRKLLGRIEEVEHSSQQMGSQKGEDSSTELSRLDAVVSKNHQRIVFLEQYLGLEPSDLENPNLRSEVKVPAPVRKDEQVPTAEKAEVKLPTASREDEPVPPPAKAVQQPSTDTSETGLYNSSKALLDKEDYENSRIGFEEFIKLYPKSENADNARFWIAESYYREKWYEKAILEYQKVIEKYSKGNKVASSRLKQGFAFANLGEKSNARLILRELIKKHPGTNEAKIAAEKLKTLE